MVVRFSIIATLLISVQVSAQNQPPVALDNSYTAFLNQELRVDVPNGLLANDSDPDGGNLIVNPEPVSAPASGTLSLNRDGSFEYISQNGFVGTVNFEYQVCDDGTANQLVSRFDFDTPALTAATVGPDANFINPDAVQTGCGVRIPASLTGGAIGLNVNVPNTGGIFDFTSLRIEFEYRDQEATAEIVSGGNFRIYHITGNNLGIILNVIDGNTGLPTAYTQNLGGFAAGNASYSIEYDEINGDVLLAVNGSTTVFSNVAPDYSPLDSSLAGNVTIGRQMDNSGSTLPSLCSMAISDASRECDTAIASVMVSASLITNRKITHRVKKD